MSDRMPAEIRIGGALPKHLAPAFCRVVREAGGSLHWDEPRFRPHSAGDLLAARQNRRLVLRATECPDGEFTALEQFLCQRHMPFDRWTEGKFDYNTCRVAYRSPRRMVVTLTDRQWQLLTAAVPLWRIAADMEALVRRVSRPGTAPVSVHDLRQLARRLRRALPVRVPPLPAFVVF